MEYRVKVTVLDTKLYPELQEKYCMDPKSGACPVYHAGDEFIFYREGGRDDFWHMGQGTLARTNADPVHRVRGIPCFCGGAGTMGASIAQIFAANRHIGQGPAGFFIPSSGCHADYRVCHDWTCSLHLFEWKNVKKMK